MTPLSRLIGVHLPKEEGGVPLPVQATTPSEAEPSRPHA
jgi:hypothetical protein